VLLAQVRLSCDKHVTSKNLLRGSGRGLTNHPYMVNSNPDTPLSTIVSYRWHSVRLPLGSLPQTEDINRRYMLRRGYYIFVQHLLHFEVMDFTISFHFHLRCPSPLLRATKVSLLFHLVSTLQTDPYSVQRRYDCPVRRSISEASQTRQPFSKMGFSLQNLVWEGFHCSSLSANFNLLTWMVGNSIRLHQVKVKCVTDMTSNIQNMITLHL
jgi:hypothetical protein